MPEQQFFQPSSSSPPSSQEPQYVPNGVPIEKPSKNAGKIRGIFSIICAGLALFFSPLIFGVTGIILGNLAYKKGEKILGMIGIILSVICMIGGIILAYLLIPELEKMEEMFSFLIR